MQKFANALSERMGIKTSINEAGTLVARARGINPGAEKGFGSYQVKGGVVNGVMHIMDSEGSLNRGIGSENRERIRGIGVGSKIYGSVARSAYEHGVTHMGNDLGGRTSTEARRVWDGMIKRGHPVTKVDLPDGNVNYRLDLKKHFER